MGDYSRASSVLCSRAKPDRPVKLEVWAAKMENGTVSTAKPVVFYDEKELVAGSMREYCEHKGIRIHSPVPYSPSSNGVAEGQQHAVRAMLHDSTLRRPSSERLRKLENREAMGYLMGYKYGGGYRLDPSHWLPFTKGLCPCYDKVQHDKVQVMHPPKTTPGPTTPTPTPAPQDA